MLSQICSYLRNYFVKEAIDGRFTISSGMIELPFMMDGQRFWLLGSVFNDGIYTYHESGIGNDDDTEAAQLKNETFKGRICAMAVPPSVIALAEEIGEWVEKYGDAQTSPYKSESVIGVYSYEKSSYGGSNGTSIPVTWQDIYKSRLNRWKKVGF